MQAVIIDTTTGQLISAAESSSITIDGNTGSATGSTITITTGASNVHGTAVFNASSATVVLIPTDANANTGWGLS